MSARLRVLAFSGLLLAGLLAMVRNPVGEPAAQIQIRAGFVVERLYAVPKAQGSWVAMCFDDRGRIYASSEGPQGLFRLTLPPLDSKEQCKVELVSSKWGHCQGMAFINGSLYVVQHGSFPQNDSFPSTISRLDDTNGDDRLDAAETLFTFPALTDARKPWWEHHVHGIVPGPDGKTLYVVGGDRDGLPCEKGRTPKHWNRDSWGVPSVPEPYAGGWVMRTDLEGQNPEYLCMGLRNCYDLAFNRQGDLFTFDSDLELDLGMPNYRPTAIRQVLSGTDSGWASRAFEMNWSWTPKWEEFQPPIKNIGPGSPTGLCFGYRARFPAAYQETLFACDWTFGRIFAVHLLPSGATYQADVELFLSAKGLPVTDLAVSPTDGALYFTVGGRGGGSALYRVTYHGQENTTPSASKSPDPGTAALHKLRRELESFHGEANPRALALAWPMLAHQDRAIRGAARAALEWQPVAEWKERALAETDPRIALQSLLALARSTDGDKAVQPALLTALGRLDFAKLPADEQCWYLRILTVSASRHGMYPADVVAKLVKTVLPSLPSPDRRVNEELVTTLAAFRSDGLIRPTLDLFERSRTQEEQILYVDGLLSTTNSGEWTPRLRERFFQIAVERVPGWKGGAHVEPKREASMKAVVAMLSDEQRAKFSKQIATARKPSPKAPQAKRPFVKEWKLEDLVPVLDAGLKHKRNLQNGRALFSEANCVVCHSFQGEGGLAGPDLSRVGGRYSPRDLLDNILNPNKVINEQYGQLVYEMKSGKQIIGRLVETSGHTDVVATNPTNPLADHVRIHRNDVENIRPSRVSSMPDGLLNTFTQDDILDLLAYLLGP